VADAVHPITITLPTSDWVAIDGDLDSVVATAVDSGDAETARIGSKIRQTGRQQIADWPAKGRRHGWPAEGVTTAVALERADWLFVLDVLTSASENYTSIASELPDPAGNYNFEFAELGASAGRLAERIQESLG
jgi:hypothetical protein